MVALAGPQQLGAFTLGMHGYSPIAGTCRNFLLPFSLMIRHPDFDSEITLRVYQDYWLQPHSSL